MMKVCFNCKVEKPLQDFYKSNTRYYQRECKVCTKDRKNAWSKTPEGKESSKRTKLKARFGMSIEQYGSLLLKQNNCCAICGVHEKEFTHKLAVDHCHTTGTIRGLLCKPCNLALGNMMDNPARLRVAALYLEHFEKVKGVA